MYGEIALIFLCFNEYRGEKYTNLYEYLQKRVKLTEFDKRIKLTVINGFRIISIE